MKKTTGIGIVAGVTALAVAATVALPKLKERIEEKKKLKEEDDAFTQHLEDLDNLKEIKTQYENNLEFYSFADLEDHSPANEAYVQCLNNSINLYADKYNLLAGQINSRAERYGFEGVTDRLEYVVA